MTMTRSTRPATTARSWVIQTIAVLRRSLRSRTILLIGIPGCGKSLTAKAVGALWQMPLLRLDVGKVFSGLVGSSEENIRKVIQTAEAVAPAILWLDELEKGFSGVQSSGQSDAGTTARVFGSFITWLQEKESAVFVIATANDVSLMPPELLRKGRFDEIFFVDMPSEAERREIAAIHLTKKKRDPEGFDLEAIGRATRGISTAIDCNSRYCWLDPEVGAKHAVAEASRNVVCTGAKPLAMTNCLNFGNPEKPAGYYQLSKSVAGLAEACRVLSVPVVSGNVSL